MWKIIFFDQKFYRKNKIGFFLVFVLYMVRWKGGLKNTAL